MPKMTAHVRVPTEVDADLKKEFGGQSITAINMGISMTIEFSDPNEKDSVKASLESWAETNQPGITHTIIVEE